MSISVKTLEEQEEDGLMMRKGRRGGEGGNRAISAKLALVAFFNFWMARGGGGF